MGTLSVLPGQGVQDGKTIPAQRWLQQESRFAAPMNVGDRVGDTREAPAPPVNI